MLQFKSFNRFTWINIFSIAMAFLESAVVVYLREIYYPNGFVFPLQPIEFNIALTEILREFATILMLIAAGFFAGKTKAERFAWFLYCFAIWDIFYYVFLKLLLDWPTSLLTWDVLFLIPITWVGPVIAPIIVSITMILLATILIKFNQQKGAYLDKAEWGLLVIGSCVVVFSFILDYSNFILDHYSLSELWSLQNDQALFDLSKQYIPQKFNWYIFLFGEAIIVSAIYKFYHRFKS